MKYTKSGEPDPACLTGTGDITQVTAEVCRTNPFTNTWDIRDGIEAECIFPYTLNGETLNRCILDEITGFTRPVFRCPIRTLKNVGNDYSDASLIGGEVLGGFFCPTNR